MFCRVLAGRRAVLVIFAAAALLWSSGSGCGRNAKPPVRWLTIVPFENLSDDPSLDWVGGVLSEAAQEQLTGLATVLPVRAGGFQEGSTARVTEVFRGYYTQVGIRLRLEVNREDTATRRTAESIRFEEEVGNVVALASTLARRIESTARPPETASAEALRALVDAKTNGSPAAAQAAYERAVAADPNFGAAYVAWAQTLLLRGDRPGAAAVVEKARGRGPALAELRRAELDLVWATLAGNDAGRRGALLALSRLTPADPDVQRSLAREELVARRFGAAVDCYRKAAEMDPSSIPVWNQLIYTQAFNGNLAGARSAFSRYRRLAPEDANPLDSLADALYYRGAFAEAEKYYLQAFDKNPSFLGSATLYKAARARLMTGDVRGADQLYTRYAEERRKAKDVLSGFVDAQWQYLTGRKEGAIQVLSALSMKPEGSVAGLAKAQLAAWALAEGRQQDAVELAEAALGREQAPLARRTASLVRYLAEPSLSVEMPEGAVKRLWESYRLLLAKRFQEATTTLAELANESDPLAPEQTGILLAWAQIECGRADLAAPWLEVYGVPQPGLEPPLGFLTFPRVFQLRSSVLEKQGHSREAAKMREIYLRLAGA